MNLSKSFKTALIVISTAGLLAACGGGQEETTNPGTGVDNTVDNTGGNTDNTGGNASNDQVISATPAFLSRSCDGQNSPQLFCPNTNGG